MKIKTIFLSITFLLCSLPSLATKTNETKLKYNVNGSSGWVPYYIPNEALDSGILGELVPKLLSIAEIEIEKHNYPPKRTNQALETGLLDFDFVSPSWFANGDMGAEFIQSEPVLNIQENIITLKKNSLAWADIDKIKDQSIGTVRGYLYHDDDVFKRVDFTSEQQLILALHKNRVEAAISGDLPALYWAKKLNLPISLAAVHSDGVLVMRLRKEHQALMPQINAAIAKLKSDGTIQSLVHKYTNADYTL
nr:transporter substrate-binding domain-containing protein [Shewanella donghaensis]